MANKKTNKPKRLSRHQYSGRLLPHHHTSYLGISILISLFGLVLLGFSAIRVSALTLTESGSVTVGGIVYGPPPTAPAVIVSPGDGDNLNHSPIVVSGTCGAGLLVKITRNDNLAGSTVCTPSGTFSLNISLVSGKNILKARNYDFQDQAGPDSPAVTVYFNQISTTDDQSTPATQTPSKSSSILSLTSTTAMMTIKPGDGINWPFEISGGQSPYAILISWGDNETSLLSITQAGSFNAKHIYRQPGTYKVIIKATDALGNQAILELVSHVQGAEVLPQVIQGPRFYDQVLPLILAWPMYLFLATLVTSFWLGEKYYQHRLFAYLKANKIKLKPSRLPS